MGAGQGTESISVIHCNGYTAFVFKKAQDLVATRLSYELMSFRGNTQRASRSFELGFDVCWTGEDHLQIGPNALQIKPEFDPVVRKILIRRTPQIDTIGNHGSSQRILILLAGSFGGSAYLRNQIAEIFEDSVLQSADS